MPKQRDGDLERYLIRLAGCLRLMPDERRAAELDEVRAHLADLCERYRESGMHDAQAVATALRQFGPWRRVGGQLLRAWFRENPKNLPGTAWSTAGWAFVVFIAMQWLWLLGSAMIQSIPAARSGSFYFYFAELLSPLLSLGSGYLIGRLAPRHWLAGALSLVALQMASLALVGQYQGMGLTFVATMLQVPRLIWMLLDVAQRILGAYMGRTDRIRRRRRRTSSAMRLAAG